MIILTDIVPQVRSLLYDKEKQEKRMLRLRVKEIAQVQKLSMNMLSHRSEVSYNVIKSIYRNPYRAMSTETINKIAKALGVPATDLLEDVSEEYAQNEMEERKKK